MSYKRNYNRERAKKGITSPLNLIIILVLIIVVGVVAYLLLFSGSSATIGFGTKTVSGKVGQLLAQDGYEWTVSQLSHNATAGNTTAISGQEFLSVFVTLTSGGNIDLGNMFFQDKAPFLADSDNFYYPLVRDSTAKSPPLGKIASTLKKGDKTDGWLTFQVPTSAKGLVLSFDPPNAGLGQVPILFKVALDDSPAAAPSSTQAVGTKGNLNQTVGEGPYFMTVTQVEVAAQLNQGSSPTKAAADQQFVSMEVIMESRVDLSALVNSNDFSLKSGDGFKFKRTGASKKPELQVISALPKGLKTRGWLTFTLPKTAKGLTLELNTTGQRQAFLQVNLGV